MPHTYYKVNYRGGSVWAYGKHWTAWPWSKWVKVKHPPRDDQPFIVDREGRVRTPKDRQVVLRAKPKAGDPHVQ